MPIVKAQTFHKGGHHASCRERRAYLERDCRHICRDTINVVRPDSWDKELDASRASYALRGDVTYREYVISPSEGDRATAVQMRELAWEWAERNFPENEVVIVLHDDNRGRAQHGEDGIVHAHVIVNSIDLERGRKMNVSNERVRELHNSAQEIAGRMGLSRIEDYRVGERLRSHQERRMTHAERQMEIRGADGWKAVMRDMALQAREQSGTLREFQGCLRMADIDMEVRKNRIYLVDRDNRDHAVRADRLDRSLSAKELSRVFADSFKVDQRGKERIREKRLATELRREIERSRHEAVGADPRDARIAQMRREKNRPRSRERERKPRQKDRMPKREMKKKVRERTHGIERTDQATARIQPTEELKRETFQYEREPREHGYDRGR